VLTNALKDVAQTRVPKNERKCYLESNPDYRREVYRVSSIDASKCWYGFIYERNDSAYELKTNIVPTLKGLEIIGRKNCDLRIPAGQDDIIILRRTEGNCSYSLSYSTLPRGLSDAEMIRKAKQAQKKMVGENLSYQTNSSLAGVCIFLQNTSQSNCLKVNLKFPVLQNL